MHMSSEVRFDLASITNKRILALSIAFIEDNLVIREILSADKSSIPAVSIKIIRNFIYPPEVSIR